MRIAESATIQGNVEAREGAPPGRRQGSPAAPGKSERAHAVITTTTALHSVFCMRPGSAANQVVPLAIGDLVPIAASMPTTFFGSKALDMAAKTARRD